MSTKNAPAITGAPAKNDLPGDGEMVKVRALRTFHKDGFMLGEMVRAGDPPFDIPRGRAAELRANGLIAYESADDDRAIHGEAGAAKIAESVQRDADARRMPDRHKTAPLRNPEVRLADVEQTNS